MYAAWQAALPVWRRLGLEFCCSNGTRFTYERSFGRTVTPHTAMGSSLEAVLPLMTSTVRLVCDHRHRSWQVHLWHRRRSASMATARLAWRPAPSPLHCSLYAHWEGPWGRDGGEGPRGGHGGFDGGGLMGGRSPARTPSAKRLRKVLHAPPVGAGGSHGVPQESPHAAESRWVPWGPTSKSPMPLSRWVPWGHRGICRLC